MPLSLPTGVGLPGCTVAQVTADLLARVLGLFFAGTLAWHEPSDAVSTLLLLPVMKLSKCSLRESSLFSPQSGPRGPALGEG